MFKAETRDTLGNGKHKAVLITHSDEEGNSIRIGHLVLPESLVSEFVGLINDRTN